MDFAAAWSTIGKTTKSGTHTSALALTNTLDALAPMCAPFAARWDAEADRRMTLRTSENLKALMEAQKQHTSARVTSAQAKSQRQAARTASSNPLSTARRAARTADKAARQHKRQARAALKVAKANYPSTLRTKAIQAHAVHAVPGAAASWLMSTAEHLTIWPASVSAGLIVVNVSALWLGRRKVTVATEDGLSTEERQLVERLDPSYWVQHADARGLSGTVTTPASVTSAGIECNVRLDGQWTVKKLRSATDNVRALLGARTDLPMLVAAGARGGWGVIRLRTRSAAPDGPIPWSPGDAFGVDMVTGEDVQIPLGHRMLIAGMSGAGKSIASRPLLFDASEGPTNVLVIIDLKKVEGRLWDHRARVAYTPEEVVELVQELVDEMIERLDSLPKGQATLVPTAERPRITIVVDEGAEVVSSCTKVEIVTGYTEKGAAITEMVNALDGLESIARMGRAPAMDLVWMTQSPTYNDGVPRQIAKQLGLRIGLAVESPSEARVVFGESAQDKGWKADELPLPGVAMVRDGKRGPDPVKVRFMADDAVVALPDQRIWQRGATAPASPKRPPLRLVKGEDSVMAPPATTEAAAEVPAQTGPVSNRDKVLAAVVDGARTARDITDRTGLNKGTVSREVKALIASGSLVKGADGMLTAGEVSA
ncbi:hypothetical protein [Streptomyces lannensis]|uniref:FtsK domain-containing protein n=1 Tax=Streptomyces lannensis TaxID=766498 RepID=A0ABP7LUY4_9ACTN